MNEIVIKVLIKLFKLIEGRLPQNVCKVLGTAFLAGAVFSALCLPGENTARALFCLIVFLLLDCFFWSMSLMYEEVRTE